MILTINADRARRTRPSSAATKAKTRNTESMYELARKNGEEAKKEAASPSPFGAGFDKDTVEKVETLVTMASSFSDPGPDFTVFIAYDATGIEIGRNRVEGY